MAQISNCLKLISKLDERDQDALVARLDELQAQGVPAEKAQIQAAVDVLTAVQREDAPVVRSAARPEAVVDDDGDMPGAKYAEFADEAYIRFGQDSRGRIRLQSMASSDSVRGREMLRWLGDEYGRKILVDEVTNSAMGFWDRMRYEGLIEDWSVDQFTGKTVPVSAASAKRSASRAPAGVVIVEVEDGFDAMKDGKRIGRLRDNLPRGAAEQLDENASVDIVKVDDEFKGKGVGSALYDAFNEKHGGRIAPSGKTSPESWALWKRKYPEKVDAFVEAEAGRIRDGADPFMVTRNITDPDVARRVSEAAGDVVIRSASRQTETPEFKAWFGGSKVVDEQGRPLVVYHGTTNDFSEFNRSRANIESDMGAGFYFSNTPDDVAANYAGEGPDLTQRIELLAERLVSNDEFDDMDEARKVARQRLSEGRPNTMPVYLSLQKPVVLGGKKETFFDYTEEYNEERGEYQEPAGKLVDFVEALRQVLYDDRWDDADAEQVVADIFQAAEGEGLKATKLIEIAKGSEGLAYAVDNDGDGSLASTEILRRAFQGAGFDGIVDNTVDAKFGSQSEGARRFNKGMKGMGVGTVHYIAFEPEQIKSATGNRGTFDPADANITRSVARTQFNGKDVTIEPHDRWSIYQERSAQLGDGMVRWVEDPDMAYVTDIQAGAKARGKAMLEWLAKDSGKALYAVGVVEDSAEFWDKMEDADLIQGQTDENFVDYFGLRRSVTRPEFFSQLERAVAAVPDRLATMAAPQWKLWLDANAPKLGVKKDEIEWSGVKDYLTLRGKDKVTRDQLVAYLGDSGVRVQEVVLGTQLKPFTVGAVEGGWAVLDMNASPEVFPNGRIYRGPFDDKQDAIDEAEFQNEGLEDGGIYRGTGDASSATKYSQYTVPGGSNYREVLITLPHSAVVEPVAAEGRWRLRDKFTGGFMRANGSKVIGFDSEAEARAAINQLSDPGMEQFVPGYKSSHWGQRNILAHLRVDDRTDADGKRVLFINEVQSDWGQDGKKKGFKGEQIPAYQVQWSGRPIMTYETRQEADDHVARALDAAPDAPVAVAEVFAGRHGADPSELQKVPRAPFVTDTKAWASLALKRAIMMAVEEGHDRIAFITGQQAADLYDLSKQISRVEFSDASSGGIGDADLGAPDGAGNLSAFDLAGKRVIDTYVTPDKIEDYVGKEVARKLLESDPKAVRAAGIGMRRRSLDGLDLKVGGEGMRVFYDEIIPQVARDVLKKLGGGQLEEVSINAGVNTDTSEIRWSEDTDGIQTIEWDGGERQFDTEDEARTFRDSLISNRTTQTGFTITPAMREKVAAGVPLFSKGRTASGADWESPSASKFDDLVYKFQDKQIDTKRVVEAIKEASGALRDDLNVYLNEELYHGRAAKRTEDFVNMELSPLIEDMAKAKMTIADLEEFLHARHAKEANAVIAQRNPGEPGLQDGGSGMTNAEADNYMATLPAADRQKLEAAAAKVDAIIAGTRKMFVDYELESQATVDAWDGMFKHYVPLQREDKEGSPGLGQGFSIKGKETKGRTGSTRKVVDILANIAMQRERAIVRGEKNRVAQSLVGLVRANENPDFWLVDEVPTERVFNPNTGLVEDRVDPLYKSRDNAVVAKIKDPSGAVREHAVLFNEEDPRALRMAQALKNLDAPNLEGLLGVSAKITRYFAAISTQYNPVFGVTNLVRDVQAALINLSSTPLAGDQKKIAKYTASALAGIYGDLRKARHGQAGNSQWAQLWEEFQNVGGQTGYRDLFRTSADRAKSIQKALNPTAWMDNSLGKIFTAGGTLRVPMAEAQRGGKWLFDLLSDYNDALENGTRLAAYKAGIERGLSKEQAASIAKNLTTSFNRKGNQATQAGALYAFFNAAIQGTARIGQTIFTMEPGKPKTMRLSPTGKKIVYGGILLGSIQALILAAAGFNEEDPPEFSRERNLIIPTGGKTYASIPIPLGLHVIPNIGRLATEFVLSGFKDPAKRTISAISLFADAFNPIGSAGLSMQTLAPTAIDPLVALTENRDWTGKPIARESSNRAIPGHALGRDTATGFAEFMSEAINSITGGNQHVSGVLSPKPEQIDYLLGQLTGGVGREYSKTEQTLKAIIRGEDLPTYKIPLVGRFVGNAKGQASEGSAFYANVEKLNRLETEAKGLREAGKRDEAQALLSSNRESYLITQANYAERQVQRLRKQKSELVKAGAPREQVRAMEEQVTQTMARLNRAMEALEARRTPSE